MAHLAKRNRVFEGPRYMGLAHDIVKKPGPPLPRKNQIIRHCPQLSEQVAQKLPSAALSSSFVTEAHNKVRLSPHSSTPSGHPRQAAWVGNFLSNLSNARL